MKDRKKSNLVGEPPVHRRSSGEKQGGSRSSTRGKGAKGPNQVEEGDIRKTGHRLDY